MSRNGLVALACLSLLMSCGLKPDSSHTESLSTRAESIRVGLVARLQKDFPHDQGPIWAETSISLNDDWLIQSPGLWGIPLSDIPKGVDCDAGDARCNASFKRLSCESDGDCEGLTQCGELEASVAKPGDAPAKLCLYPADHLVDRYYKVMVSAEHELDITSLALPTGQFREAIINAISFVSQKADVPSIRLLFSGAKPALPNPLYSTDRALKEIVNDVAARGGDISRLQINLAYMNPGRLSWNHAKIVAADGDRVISGGHNLWSEAYLNAQPVTDISMEYHGEAASAARDFANTLWTMPHNSESYYPAAANKFEPFSMPSHTPGNKKAITVGRLGAFGDNPSEDALNGLIDLAQNSIYIDQQDLYNVLVTNLTRSYVEDSLIRAAVRGVHIKIVQSNKYPTPDGYGTTDGGRAYASIFGKVRSAIAAARGVSDAKARTLACEAIEYAPFRFSDFSNWDAGLLQRTIGTHAKLLIVDESAFYIGSHNLYPSNLQEFGVIVTDPEATSQLIASFWNNVWGQSLKAKYPCPS